MNCSKRKLRELKINGCGCADLSLAELKLGTELRKKGNCNQMQLENAPIPWKILRLADSEIEFTAKGKVQVIFRLLSLQIGSSICDE